MTDPVFSILDLKPDDVPDMMIPAWLGCLHWALGNQAILAAFREDTGNRWTPASDALGSMIDKATGADVDFLRAFVQWVNVRIWGPVGQEEGGA